ncbi:hypothetical protein JD969_03560 [Planctomycetota bacterium]|nr:hypothetical protein JD969_03560 [Planctomycetota bacterium]
MVNIKIITIFSICAMLLSACVGISKTHAAYQPTRSQKAFLNELSRRSFLFFWEQGQHKTGLIPDQAQADGSGHGDVASVAAVGFGLTAYCIADERGWESHDKLEERTLNTLRFFANEVETERGFYYHFLNMETGKRAWKCELSSIDTALFVAGVLTAKQHFDNSEIKSLATKIYERIDWEWMRNGKPTLTMGWKPEEGFLNARWSSYNELMLLYVLAIGSPTHSIGPDAWDAWGRNRVVNYGNKTFLSCPPLFTHQYSHAWIDFENKRDKYADYFLNSRLATLAQQQYCDDLSKRFPKYSKKLWGLTASVGPKGYMVWGGPPGTITPAIDGSIVPCAPGGSIPFAPEACVPTLYYMYKQFGNKVWKRYGLIDAFNPHTNWYADDVLGIDVGITLLMAENYKDRFVWKTFHKNPEINKAMKQIGFKSLSTKERSKKRTSSVFFRKKPVRDIRKNDKPLAVAKFNPEHKVGNRDWQTMILNGPGVAKFAFTWDENKLVFHAQVSDIKIKQKQPANKLYLDDCVELFIDPKNDGIKWKNKEDWQIGFAPPKRVYEWFGENRSHDAVIKTNKNNNGFTVRYEFQWSELGLNPRKGLMLGVSPVVNQTELRYEGKTEWHFVNNGKKIEVGLLRLSK